MKLIGYSTRTGSYQGHDYSNVILTVQRENKENDVGVVCDNIKVKGSVFDTCLQQAKLDRRSCIGHSLDVYYNSYRQVDLILFK